MNKPYATSHFLIYSSWDRIRPGQSTLSGSLLIDCATTEMDAVEKVTLYTSRLTPHENTATRIIYMKNRPEWWNESQNPV